MDINLVKNFGRNKWVGMLYYIYVKYDNLEVVSVILRMMETQIYVKK
jgi:hypothetical protein